MFYTLFQTKYISVVEGYSNLGDFTCEYNCHYYSVLIEVLISNNSRINEFLGFRFGELLISLT